MKIMSFEIKNFRSIKDSGACYVSGDKITILAGKNESGKTAILEALEDFSTEREIRKEAINIHNREAKPEIAVTFQIEKRTLNEIFGEINLAIKAPKIVNVKIIKDYPAKYSFSEETIKSIGIKDERLLKIKGKEIANSYKKIKDIHEEFPQISGTFPELNPDDILSLKPQLENFFNEIEPNLIQITNEEKKENFAQGIKNIVTLIIEIEVIQSAEEKLLNEIKQWIPNFILFSSFNDIFPSKIPFSEAVDNDLIKDLCDVSNLNLALIQSDETPSKMKHKENLNLKIKEDYSKFWSQDFTNLHIDWDSQNLYFYIKDEDGEFYPHDYRSRGKQWHLAFYIRISARAKEDVPNIILIDEPGLFLHAKAQKDILKKLEYETKNVPIIFSTHSPFLIKTDNLSRIRLISRTPKRGTVISDKIHKGADKETLTPIITAIGLDLSIGLDVAKDNNIILEGITDYYYLLALKELLGFKFKKSVHFIPGVGADKLNLLVSLMIGWKLTYCAVFDNDKKGRDANAKLLKAFKQADIKTMLVSENSGEEIEDLFTKEDFVQYVLDEKPDPALTKMKNSEIVKQKHKNYDTALLAKLFYEKINNGSISLTVETKERFEKLLSKINIVMF
ncbi:MAG: AAA family ATPase [Candidatus Zapsychrus exili]|nr:AAA family ATPase [Candidatus Zapsychrus exili]